MAFITVNPEVKHNLARVARELEIEEELLRSANRSAQKHQLYCPGYMIEEQNDKELHTIQDIKSFLQPRRLSLSDNWVEQGKIYDDSAVEKEIKKIIDVFPFVSCREIGCSVLGRPILELKVGGEHTGKKVHMNASFHANEWITTSVLLKWFKEYCMSLCCNSPFSGFSPMKLFRSTALSLVPLVNPDGVDLVLNGSEGMGARKEELERLNGHRPNFNEWKANINGVDLNKQFPSLWEIEKYRKPPAPSHRDFPGFSPLTEPESITMYRLITEDPPDRLLALHTQGEEIYWGYKGLEPEESAAVIKDFEKVSGNIYKGVRDIDSYAGFRDWFIHHYFKEGYTVELGKGQNPLPFQQFSHIYNATKGILWRSLFFHE